MTELYPTDAELNALSGAVDGEQEVLYVAAGESPYYTSFYRMQHRLLDVARRAGDLRVFRDGAMTFGVRAGRFLNADQAVDYAGASGQALTNNAVNYVYLTASGVLTVSTSGFPAPSVTAHIPLATVTTSAGEYSHDDIVDYRGRAIYSVRRLELPQLVITAGAEDGNLRLISIQAKDTAGANLARRFRVRAWISLSEYGPPGGTQTVSQVREETLRTVQANCDYEIITDSTGLARMDVSVSGDDTRYVMAEIDGRVFSSGAIVWQA